MSVSVFSDWKYSISEQFQKCLDRKRKAKTFSYDTGNISQTFELDTTSDGRFYYMTAQKAGVQSGDYIQISYLDGIATYQVKEIDYYSEPSDMWMAKLLKLNAT